MIKVYTCLEGSEAKKECYYSGSTSVVPRASISATSGNLLEEQNLRPHPRPAESETVKVELSHLCFIKPSKDSDPNLTVRTTSLF